VLALALRRRAVVAPGGIPRTALAALVREQILTDNATVFTGRFGPGGSASEVMFDQICVENGIRLRR
jgi:hypothetical protein